MIHLKVILPQKKTNQTQHFKLMCLLLLSSTSIALGNFEIKICTVKIFQTFMQVILLCMLRADGQSKASWIIPSNAEVRCELSAFGIKFH